MAASHYSGMLPDPLRLKLGGLQPLQLQVYEDFSRVRTLQIQAGSFALHPRPPNPEADLILSPQSNALEEPRTPNRPRSRPRMCRRSPTQLRPSRPSSAALRRWRSLPWVSFAIVTTRLTEALRPQALVGDLEKILATESVPSLQRLGPESDIRHIIQQIPLIAASSVSRDETALGCSQKIVQLLYRSETALAREVYVFLLERLCSIFVKVAKEVTAWLVYAEDERKFNVPVTIALVQARLINAAELDVQLAKFVTRDYRPSVIDFAARFVAECLMEVPPVATREQLAHSLEALAQAARTGKGTET